MEKTIAICSIMFSLCILIIGCYIYFIGRNKKWIPVNADILRIQVIKKLGTPTSPITSPTTTSTKETTTPIKSTSKLSVKFGFKVGSADYHPVFNDDLLEIKKNDIRKDLIKNKKLLIYYDVENPNISYIKRPNDGITFIFFGLILLIISILFLNSIKVCTKIPQVEIKKLI
jgi:hypothetical protein